MAGTLLNTERLVRKIAAAIGNPVSLDDMESLAEKYKEECEGANERLRQCEAILRGGDLVQALQSAESSPNLLDLVTLLAFSKEADWRKLCVENSLPQAPLLDERAIRALNQCYASGIQADNPLYAVYRSAILKKNHLKALEAIGNIARLAPNDASAAAEHKRLDSQIVGELSEQLDMALAGGNLQETVDLMSEIEAREFLTRPDSRAWKRAVELRCGILLEKAARGRSQGDWREVQSLLDYLVASAGECGLFLEKIGDGGFVELERWAWDKARGDQSLKEHESVVNRLRQELRLVASQESELHRETVKSLMALSQRLEAPRKELIALGVTPPPELAKEAQRLLGLLEQAIRAKRVRRRFVRSAVGTGVVLCVGFLIYLGVGWFKSKRAAAALAAMRADQSLASGTKLLNEVRERGWDTRYSFVLAEELGEWDALLERQRQIVEELRGLLRETNTSPGGAATPEAFGELNRRTGEARELYSSLSSDTRSEIESAYEVAMKTADAALAKLRGEIDGRVRKEIDRVESLRSELSLELPMAGLKREGEQLREAMESVGRMTNALSGVVACEAETISALSGLNRLVGERADIMMRAENGMAGLASAETAEAYYKAVAILADVPLAGIPETSACRDFKAEKIDADTLERAALFDGSRDRFDFMRKHEGYVFAPPKITAEEDMIYADLRNHIAMGADFHRYRVYLDPEREQFQEWLCKGKMNIDLKRNGWRKTNVFNVLAAPSGPFVLKPVTYGIFDGKFQLNLEKRPEVDSVEYLGLSKETGIFHDLDLGDLYDDGGSGFRVSILSKLDEIKATKDGDPLLAAFLFQEFYRMMENRPREWGLAYAPSLENDWALLSAAAPEGLRAGDWYLPDRRTRYEWPLSEAFKRFTKGSYRKQAIGLYRLAEEGSKAGFELVGYMGPGGDPVLKRESFRDTSVWGLHAKTGAAAALFYFDRDRNLKNLREGTVMSPLFALRISNAKLLDRADVDLTGEEFSRHVPNYFLSARGPAK
jgi:hypothetical protein